MYLICRFESCYQCMAKGYLYFFFSFFFPTLESNQRFKIHYFLVRVTYGRAVDDTQHFINFGFGLSCLIVSTIDDMSIFFFDPFNILTKKVPISVHSKLSSLIINCLFCEQILHRIFKSLSVRIKLLRNSKVFYETI